MRVTFLGYRERRADLHRGRALRELASLQAASCTYRIALGPRAGQKVLSLRTVAGRDEKTTTALCADAHGFSLHAAVRCGAHQRQELERLCRYITRPAIANERQLWSECYDRTGSGARIRPNEKRPFDLDFWTMAGYPTLLSMIDH